MAKEIQNLPENTPNPAVLATLGWRDIRPYIDYAKITFVHRILGLEPSSVYRILFIRRFFFILANGIYSNLSPISQIIKSCVKYGLLDRIVNCINSGIIPPKSKFKQSVARSINERCFASWRFELTLYPRLQVYRAIVTKSQAVCWWSLTKCLPYLKAPCITIMKLVCGSNTLAVNTKCNVPRHERICTLCTRNEVEDVAHFVLHCDMFNDTRTMLLAVILNCLTGPGQRAWAELSENMVLYILLGLDYPMSVEDIFCIRYISCIYLNQMYKARQALEPP